MVPECGPVNITVVGASGLIGTRVADLLGRRPTRYFGATTERDSLIIPD
jgi:hypothetical protein